MQSDTLFSKLRASRKKSTRNDAINTIQRNPKVIRSTTNTTYANSIALNAGSLIVGSSHNNITQGSNLKRLQVSRADFEEVPALSKNSLDSPSHKRSSHELELYYHETRVSNELIQLDLSQFKDIRQNDLCEFRTYNGKITSGDDDSTTSGGLRKKIYFIAKDNCPFENKINAGTTVTQLNNTSAALGITTTTTNTTITTAAASIKTMQTNGSNIFPESRETNDIDGVSLEKPEQQHNIGTISLLSGQLKTMIDLPTKSKVWIKKKNKKEYQADLIEINLKDCFLNRGDMWALSSHLQDTCVFSNQRLTFIEAIRGTVKGIYRDGHKVLSGYIGESTRVVFRSESAKLIFLIQITEEMWNFEETGEKLFQKMVNSLFPKIFKKWKAIDTHHSITIAFAISMDLSDSPFTDLKPGEKLKNPVDHFRIVVDQVNIIHWVQIMETLKLEFLNIKNNLLNIMTEKGYNILKGRFSPVIKSNFLELINFATTVLVDPFRQVDLRHTTTHVMIISPGSGLYDVDYDLLNLTGKKLLSLEMTMDLICLSRAPLHIVPLFRAIDYEEKLHYCIPNWLSIFFWNDSSKSIDEWHPRCKIYDLQMMGLTDNEIMEQADIPYLSANIKKDHSISTVVSNYERNIFNIPEYSSSLQDKNNIIRQQQKVQSNKSTTHTLNQRQLSSRQNTLAWRQLTFSEPVTEAVQTFNVVGDMVALNETAETNRDNTSTKSSTQETTLEPITSYNDPSSTSNSAAMDSLRGISGKRSIRDFTRNLMVKINNGIIGTKNVDKTQSRYDNHVNTNPQNGIEPKPARVNIRDTTPYKTTPNMQSSTYSISRRNSSSKTTLNIFSPPQENVKKSGERVSTSSMVKPQIDNNSQQIVDLIGTDISENLTEDIVLNYKDNDIGLYASNPAINSRPFSFFDNNPKYESNTYISNETWIEIKNPSVPVNLEIANRLLPVRWRDVWPHFVAKKYSKWRSFTTPADLPVTISAFPTKEDFKNNFFFRNHSVTLNIDQESYNQTALDLLRNIIYMRLVTGFQLCSGEQVEKLEELRTNSDDGTAVVKYIDNKEWEDIKVYLIIDSEIHRISCSQNGTIDVQRYLRKNNSDLFDQVPSYLPLIKTRYETVYRDSMIDPIHVKRPSLNWNQIDQVIAGYGDYVLDRSWHGFRSKFVVLPSEATPNNFSIIVNGKNEVLSVEELRLEGLRRLINSITKCKLRSDKEKRMKKSKKDELQPDVIFYTGSLLNFIDEHQESLNNVNKNTIDSLFNDDKILLDKNTELFKLAHELQLGRDKLMLVNRKWHWKRHLNCFVGSEMVSWLVRNLSDIFTRDDAVVFGQTLMDEGLFHHVLNKHSFLDGHYFYQFKPEYKINSQTLDGINSHHSISEISKFPESEYISKAEDINHLSHIDSKDSDSTNCGDSTNKGTKNGSTKPMVTLSSSIQIDVDSLNRSYKQEVCTVHYDRVHNPDHCFHIRLEWMTTTPKLIDDLLGNWSRICERYGLKLIELPWEELCSLPSMNPFHSFAQITLAINPWEDPEFYDKELFSSNKFYYHICLLKLAGFLLDNRASKFLQEGEINFDINYSWGKPQFKYAQYIHNSGAYIAEIRENGEFFLAPNNIHISRVTPGNIKGKYHSSSRTTFNSQTLVMEFKEKWSDYNQLHPIFEQIKKKWIETGNVDEF